MRAEVQRTRTRPRGHSSRDTAASAQAPSSVWTSRLSYGARPRGWAQWASPGLARGGVGRAVLWGPAVSALLPGHRRLAQGS